MIERAMEDQSIRRVTDNEAEVITSHFGFGTSNRINKKIQ
jgi:hypothetical protein